MDYEWINIYRFFIVILYVRTGLLLLLLLLFMSLLPLVILLITLKEKKGHVCLVKKKKLLTLFNLSSSWFEIVAALAIILTDHNLLWSFKTMKISCSRVSLSMTVMSFMSVVWQLHYMNFNMWRVIGRRQISSMIQPIMGSLGEGSTLTLS